jgi:hypothetical protein
MVLDAMNTKQCDFKHQSVRDLAWAVLSPPLVSLASQSCLWPSADWYQRAYEESSSWLGELDIDPSELESLLDSQKDRRLGKYFETLWFYWFSKNPRYEIIENNLQIIIDGETLGEIDFIVQDKVTDKLIHWEVAVKFYLGVGDTREMCNWHGPNYRDRLDIKVNHLCQRQSMLSKSLPVEKWLQQKGLSIDQCAVILKGRLYYPWGDVPEKVMQKASQSKTGDLSGGLNSPVSSASNHLYSWWFKESEFDDEFGNKQRFVPLVKQGWMENISTLSADDFFTKSDIFKTISNCELRLPLQVQVNNPCHSCDRVFIVGDNWPDDIA